MTRRQDRLIQRQAIFSREIDHLTAVFSAAVPPGVPLDHVLPRSDRAAAWHCVMALFDEWVRFCRDVVYLSASGRVLTIGGQRLRRSRHLQWGQNPEDGLKSLYLVNGLRWGAFGPKWELPNSTLDAARLFSVDNLTQLINGLGQTTPTHSELKACRNYLAHRHAGTDAHVDIMKFRRRLRVAQRNSNPAMLIGAYVPGRGVRAFDEWCIDLKKISSDSIQ